MPLPTGSNKPIPAQVQDLAEDYIRACWPDGCPPRQAIETKLAFYAGMLAMLTTLPEIDARHGDDFDSTADELLQWYQSITSKAARLNLERADDPATRAALLAHSKHLLAQEERA